MATSEPTRQRGPREIRGRCRAQWMTEAQRGNAEAYRALLDDIGPAILVTVDNLGVPDYLTSEVAARLQKKASLDPARFTVTSTHTHTGPMLRNCCPNIFGSDIPADQLPPTHREAIELVKLEGLSTEAAAARAGTTPGAFRVRAHRAYRALRQLLGS